MDLSKAFDTVNHAMLIHKLEYYGVRGKALEWFKSYLSNRKQIVSDDSAYSIENYIICGVPQGSILGPLSMTFTTFATCLILHVYHFVFLLMMQV